MQKLQPALLAVLLGTCALAPLSTPSFAQTCTCAGTGIHAETAPPPLPEYDQPPIPASGDIWTPGYWAWNNYDYYWVPGTWVDPPQEGLLWTPGYWGFSNGVYVFNAGYWGPHVGFYGGIAYGFGYTGEGYEGGRWDNGKFFYNRSVNNIGNVHIANVYNKTVTINNVTVNRVSFNGGAGGAAAKPTPEDEVAAKEQHVEATKVQRDHARTASMNGDLFDATNHGKPKVAATARPTEFRGAGVVPAKAAGAANAVAPEPGVNGELKPGEKPLNEKPQAEKPGAANSDLEKKRPEAAPIVKPEPAMNGAARPEERPAVGTPGADKREREKKAPEAAEPLAKPQPRLEEKKVPEPAEPLAKPQPRPEEKPAAERPLERPAPVEKNRIENRPPPPAAQTKRPEKKECGGPGQPQCAK